MWINKKTLIKNLIVFVPYTEGDFVEGKARIYFGLGCFSNADFVQGIVTGFDLNGEDILVCNITTTEGEEAQIVAARAKKIEDLTKRKPSPEKGE
jgi:hypothetical protein